MTKSLLLLLLPLGMMLAQDGKPRVIAIGAHPDDCDICAGGTAAKFAALGYAVKFVALSSGDGGHQSEGGGALARRRRAEAAESGRRLGIAEYITLDNHDGELLPTLELRMQVVRLIRQWHADIVLLPRPNDYHPDHRYTGIVVQDAAYLVIVPNVAPDTPPLKKNPAFFYCQDRFKNPQPFRPDIAVDISDVWDKKVDALDAHVSQMYEWMPWTEGRLDQVPQDPAARKEWLAKSQGRRTVTPAVKDALVKWYGPERAERVTHAEAFELCEYGRQPDQAELRSLFPMVK